MTTSESWSHAEPGGKGGCSSSCDAGWRLKLGPGPTPRSPPPAPLPPHSAEHLYISTFVWDMERRTGAAPAAAAPPEYAAQPSLKRASGAPSAGRGMYGSKPARHRTGGGSVTTPTTSVSSVAAPETAAATFASSAPEGAAAAGLPDTSDSSASEPGPPEDSAGPAEVEETGKAGAGWRQGRQAAQVG